MHIGYPSISGAAGCFSKKSAIRVFFFVPRIAGKTGLFRAFLKRLIVPSTPFLLPLPVLPDPSFPPFGSPPGAFPLDFFKLLFFGRFPDDKRFYICDLCRYLRCICTPVLYSRFHALLPFHTFQKLLCTFLLSSSVGRYVRHSSRYAFCSSVSSGITVGSSGLIQ